MSQNSIVVPTSGTLGGLQAMVDVNEALDTLNTKWSGASAPATAELGQEWLDTSTTPNTLRIYDGSQWLAVGTIDAANHIWLPTPKGVLTAVGSITLDATYVDKLVTDNAANVTVTFPLANSVPAGAEIEFIHQQAGTFTLQRNGADALMGADGWNATSLALTELGEAVRFKGDGSSKWYQTGKVAPAIVNSAPVGGSAYSANTTSISCTSGAFTAASNGTLIVLGSINANAGLSTTSFTASLGAWSGTTGFNAAATGSGTHRQMGWLTMTKGQSTTVTISGTTSTTFMEADLRMFFLPVE